MSGPVFDFDEARRVASRVLDAAADLVDEAEVHVDSGADSFVRFAEVGPTQCADRSRLELSIRARVKSDGGWREARAAVGSLDEADWRRTLERAVDLARVSPENPAALELPEPTAVEACGHAESTARHGIEGKVAWVDAAIRACEAADLRPAGMTQTCTEARTIANSKGLIVQGSASRASFSLTAYRDLASGLGQGSASDVDDLDVERAIARAVAKGSGSRKPEPFAPGETTVVLEPLAVSAMLLFAAYQGFGAREVEEGSSFLCGRVGERTFAEGLSITDDARHPLLSDLSFDGEGMPRTRVELVSAGLLRGPVTDRAHAARLGLPCTGHGNTQPTSEGPKAGHMVVAPGTADLDELVRGVSNGLLVTQFHYTNVIEPRDLTLTGMTRNGTFEIRDGEIVGAVRNLRFTERLVRALANVSGIGREQEVAGALFDGRVVTPALRIDGFRFTSSTDF